MHGAASRHTEIVRCESTGDLFRVPGSAHFGMISRIGRKSILDLVFHSACKILTFCRVVWRVKGGLGPNMIRSRDTHSRK